MNDFKLNCLRHKHMVYTRDLSATQNAMIEEVNKLLTAKGYLVDLRYGEYEVEGDSYSLDIYKKFDDSEDFKPNSYYSSEWLWSTTSEEVKEFIVFNLYNKLINSEFFEKIMLEDYK